MDLLERNIKSTDNHISILTSDTKHPKLCIIEIHGGIEGDKWDVAEESKDLVNYCLKNEILYISVDLSNNGTQVNQSLNEVLFSKREEDLNSVISFVKDEYKCPVILIGTSLGGLIAINTASKNTEKIIGLVINCGVVNPEDLIKRIVVEEDFNQWHTSDMLNVFNINLPYSFFEDIKNLNTPDKIKSLNIPILWFHGEEDELVPIEQVEDLSLENKSIKLVKVENGKHRFGVSMQPGKWEERLENFIQMILNS